MSAEICPFCGSERLYQFSSAQTEYMPEKGKLPQVCRACTSIIVNGEVVDMPESFGVMAVSMSEKAELEAKHGLQELEEIDNGTRIKRWLKNFYFSAYMDGFVRALAYWNHHGKEGRTVRLREIWRQASLTTTVVDPGSKNRKGIMFTEDLYNEFEQLLNMSPGATNGKSPSNKRPSL